MITSKLRKIIQELSTEHYFRLQFVETKARQLLEYSQGGAHLTFTPHGVSHISAVEQNYEWLITDQDLETFNASELFCLLCATFFHDALMIPRRLGDETAARAQHTQRANDFLIEHRDLIGLSIHEVDAISEVIRAHAVYDLTEINERVVLGNQIIDLRKLGACLSLADICHADSSRAPEVVFRQLDLNEESQYHWKRHLQISGITRQEDTILMSALTFSDQGSEAVSDYKDEIEQQLEIVRPYFDKVLRPIRRVELTDKRLESPLDQTLQFHTNTPALLKILIEGVYDREDVFVRELVQNSLDSCLLRRAKEQRRNVQYTPQILLTVFYEGDKCRAFRIDDNGIGMDLNDVRDTVLWIGNSISSRDDVITLLNQTVQKNLIATFGIGLLSCFKASNNILVRTCKENGTPLQFTLTGVADNVRPEKSTDTLVGTSLVVLIAPDKPAEIDPNDAIEYYFRQVKQVDLKVLGLEWDGNPEGRNREELFKMARTADLVPRTPYFVPDPSCIGVNLLGEDFSGSLWFDRDSVDTVVDYEGSVDILNEGIFVANEPTGDWFPDCTAFCDGVLNFSSKAITLPASRDRVIKNEVFRARRIELGEKSFALVDELVRLTHQDHSDRDYAALILSYIHSKLDDSLTDRFLRRLGSYRVKLFKQEDRESLDDLKATEPPIFIQYKKGTFVEDLTVIDGKQLYHKEDDLTELQAAMMAQEGQVVVSAVRSDVRKTASGSILEANLIIAFFEDAGVETVDLAEENVLENKYRSMPIPSSVRRIVGNTTKFVEVPGLPNKRGWKVGNEFWINLANPTMRKVYDVLQMEPLNVGNLRLITILFTVMSYRLDDAVQKIADWLGSNDD
ncbi:MAG TPA: hypothetical protein VGO56_08490 [Pyrinomonadaceae bacterium]|jgi:hypothetical protein|nr:hypothetical protein [Pyrinomonadaceae bacterium]